MVAYLSSDKSRNCATLRLEDRFVQCVTNDLINARQCRRAAQPALKLCGLLE
jgi:hypothetical protein